MREVSLDDLTEIRKQLEQLQRDRDRAQGSIERIDREIKEQFGCSPKEAKALLRELRKEEQKAEREFQSALNRFREEYGRGL